MCRNRSFIPPVDQLLKNRDAVEFGILLSVTTATPQLARRRLLCLTPDVLGLKVA